MDADESGDGDGQGAGDDEDDIGFWKSQVSRLARRLARAQSVAGYLEGFLLMEVQSDRDQSSRETPAESGRYPYIPYGCASFIQVLLMVKDLYGDSFNGTIDCAHCGSSVSTKRTFVDVGCGIADKVVLAAKVGYEAHGIEVDPYLLGRVKDKYMFRECREPRCSRELPGIASSQDTLTLYPLDALTFDYSGFDVIYFYRPFKDATLERELEQRIWRQAKPGAYVIACGAQTTPPPSARFRAIKEVDEIEVPYGAALYVREAAARRGKERRQRAAKNLP